MKHINKNRMEALVEKGAMLVDMRSPVAYRDGHINGSVNLPLRNFINTIMGKDKKTTLVIYGESETDPTISQGYNYAIQMGFQNIFISDYHTLIAPVIYQTKNPKRSR